MAQLERKVAATPIWPFRRQFPFDVMIEIIAHLDNESQRAFSLTSSQYNDEANCFLWSSPTIPSRRADNMDILDHFNQFYNALFRAPRRARYVRELQIFLGSVPRSEYDGVQLQIFHILSSVPNLRHLSIYGIDHTLVQSTENLASLLPFYNPLRLKSLKILGHLTPIWMDFLASQPDITFLKWISHSPSDVPDLPTTALPNLRRVVLHSQSTQRFVPGRPVSTINTLVHLAEDISTLARTLARSTVPVLELELNIFPSRPIDLSHLGHALPKLQYLRIQHENELTAFQLRHFPSLQVFWFISHSIPSDIMALTSGCPSLHTIIIVGRVLNRPSIWHKPSVDKPWVDLSIIDGKRFVYEPDCAQYLLENMREALRHADLI